MKNQKHPGVGWFLLAFLTVFRFSSVINISRIDSVLWFLGFMV